MTAEPENHFAWSPIMGDLRLPPGGQVAPTEPEKAARPPGPDDKVAMLIELNARYPGGLEAVRRDFYDLWDHYLGRAGGTWPTRQTSDRYVVQPYVPDKLEIVAPSLYQCVLSRVAVRDMVEEDRQAAQRGNRPPVIYRVWPDYTLYPHIDRSAPTVKADAAWRAYDARGRGIVWAVIDSGIDAGHEHFSKLEMFKEAKGKPLPEGLTSQLHRDFSYLVNPDDAEGAESASGAAGGGQLAPDPISALSDPYGHGTHVAGIISGCSPTGRKLRIAQSKDPNGGYVPRAHFGVLCGMAPACELVSIKVTRRSSWGRWVTSSSAVIRALEYLRTEVNIHPDVLRVHGVNVSLGCGWQPDNYAAGQSPLCRAVNQLVASGVVVVVSAGNSGASKLGGDAAGAPGPAAAMGSISEPAHAEDCIAVGSTHRDAPHAFGVTWTSSKGPTLDGRMKPDVVAPGEWITSAATGQFRAEAGLAPKPKDHSRDRFLTYAEESGTSMAAPHVSGIIAAFLSARPEFIGRPRQVKELLTASATNLGREPYAQGAGLVDLMRMLANV
jgi:subtilisin family serine protease